MRQRIETYGVGKFEVNTETVSRLLSSEGETDIDSRQGKECL
jgi:hypothetical protein